MSSFARNQLPLKIGPHFSDLFQRTTVVILCIDSYTLLMLLDIDECSNGSHDCDVNASCRIAVHDK